MTRITARRPIAAPAAEVFAFLGDLENHWSLSTRFEVMGLERNADGAAVGGSIRVHGPLGLYRTVRTRVLHVGHTRIHARRPWSTRGGRKSPEPSLPKAKQRQLSCRSCSSRSRLAGSRGSGGSGDDQLFGGPRVESLAGNEGDGVTIAGRDAEAVRRDPGNDPINTSDGSTGDVVACGIGNDRLLADIGDRIGADCERVLRSTLPCNETASVPTRTVGITHA